MKPDTTLPAYAKRARLERTLFIAECIASAIVATQQWIRGTAKRAAAPGRFEGGARLKEVRSR